MDRVNSYNAIKEISLTSQSDFILLISQISEILNIRQYDNKENEIKKINIYLFSQKYNNVSNLISEYINYSFENSITMDTNWSIMSKMLWHQIYFSTYTETILKIADNKIKDLITDYSTNYLDITIEWIDSKLIPFFKSITNHSTENKFTQFIIDIKNIYLYRFISSHRSLQLFEIIADFPDSINAIKELKDAAIKSNSSGLIGSTFKSIVMKRLLHPGASTTQILDFYILMIKALRVLDSSDLILNYVAKPVREYLIKRKDTVRCIITALTNSSESNLQNELRKGGSLEYGVDEDDEENGPGINWEPRLRNPDLSDGSYVKGLDILAILVSIYGSTEIFISEYRSLLANKLLNNSLYQTDEDVAFVELLKLRFGEESLHSCEVMLHDIEDSKRVNTAVNAVIQKQNIKDIDDFSKAIDFCIISDNYWPNLQFSNSFTHHPIITNSLANYQEIYTTLKKPRKLYPNDHLGMVDLVLSFDDGSVREFSVLPCHASLIYFISDRDKIDSQELSELCQIDESEINQLMNYWISRNVVSYCINDKSNQINITYQIIENQYNNSIDDKINLNSNIQESNSVISFEDKEKQSLKGLEKYIITMLTGQESMTIERIHTMLKLLSSGEGSDIQFDMNIIQFNKYLNNLIELNKIELIDRCYKLKVS